MKLCQIVMDEKYCYFHLHGINIHDFLDILNYKAYIKNDITVRYVFSHKKLKNGTCIVYTEIYFAGFLLSYLDLCKGYIIEYWSKQDLIEYRNKDECEDENKENKIKGEKYMNDIKRGTDTGSTVLVVYVNDTPILRIDGGVEHLSVCEDKNRADIFNVKTVIFDKPNTKHFCINGSNCRITLKEEKEKEKDC